MSGFMSTITKLAQTLSSALNGPVIPAVIEIGQDFLELITQAKEVVNTADAGQLQTMIEELEPKVMAHADKTEAALRGGQS